MFRFMICVLLIFIANRHHLFFKGKKGLQLLIFFKKNCRKKTKSNRHEILEDKSSHF